MKVYSNLTDPGKKKKLTTKTVATKQGPAPVKPKSSVELNVEQGKTKRTYTPAEANTGHPAYGPEGKGTKVKALLDKARSEKKDIAYDAQGKPYRAGYTIESREPDKLTAKIKVTPDIRPIKLTQQTVQTSNEKQTGGKRAGKRRLQRVDYLQGHGMGKNKRTEAGYGQ